MATTVVIGSQQIVLYKGANKHCHKLLLQVVLMWGLRRIYKMQRQCGKNASAATCMPDYQAPGGPSHTSLEAVAARHIHEMHCAGVRRQQTT